MFARIAILLSLLLWPMLGAAQAWLPQIHPAGASVDQDTATAPTTLLDELLALNVAPPQGLLMQGDRVVPLWASSDGHWLALVALSRPSSGPMLPLAPALGGVADWRLMDSASMVTGGMRWHLGSGFYSDALFGHSARGEDCSSASCRAGSGLAGSPYSSVLSGALGIGWLSPDGGVDLSYGLSWLRGADSGNSDRSSADLAAYGNGLPMLAVPGTNPYLLDSSTSLVANGRWNWGSGSSVITFGASVGQARALAVLPYAAGQISSISLQPIDLTQASLSLGMGTDTLRGVLVGRVLQSSDPAFANHKWSALDLGLSWRTPWQGELSVGAQNLWSTSDAAPADKTDPAQARMPYIQYRQDL